MSFLSSITGAIGGLFSGVGSSVAGMTPGGIIGNFIGNTLFGKQNSSGGTITNTNVPNNPFSQGWPQIAANILLVIIGIVFILQSMKAAPSLKTTVNVLTGDNGGKSKSKKSAASDVAEVAEVAE